MITLGIIGIVAALTIPTLMQKTQKHQTIVALKKAYSTLQQAEKLSEIDNGSVDDWDLSTGSKTVYETYFKNYLHISKEYFDTANPEGINYKLLNGIVATTAYSHADFVKVVLTDGTIITFAPSADSCTFFIDINGFKKPNVYGKDMFILDLQKDNGLVPYGFACSFAPESFGTTYNRTTLLSKTHAGCNKNSEGYWCAALILSDGWEIKDDYPW